MVVSRLEPTLTNKVINHSINSKKNKHEEKEHEENIEEKENGKNGKHWIRRFGCEFCLPEDHNIDEYKVFYIGQQSLNLTNLMMSYNKCQFYSYDPVMDTARQENINVNKALMKRYYMIQKAKDAQVVGIVVGTLGVADYLEIIERLKKVLSIAGKKYYTFVMGKLNVPKMANFMEIDIFVLVACPENTLIDSQEFFKPIVTPYEMEIACLRTQQWTGDYVTDFRQLLPGASYSVDLNDKDNIVDEDDCPDMSLISGQMRPNYKANAESSQSSDTSVVERNQNTTISTQRHTSGAEFLASRSWKGLEQNLGETPVRQAKEGRIGIASKYTHETDQ
ncbi:2-(3-amino-3-carboxypropyl)histidine synthase subunit 2-like [Actinia tenebrosa]|uniref:2-(3-amino-3-carboxypropyl)histidine synthase subunit 2 n=1 Tax=Actinia tenebrosa TaxID=6105 RepID=A0A6P8IVF5_ACTTE|nr:2-(3-amino-3-carboxypropyl)histidine synthase subunit 2-like [Actinia tenebrosa]